MWPVAFLNGHWINSYCLHGEAIVLKLAVAGGAVRLIPCFLLQLCSTQPGTLCPAAAGHGQLGPELKVTAIAMAAALRSEGEDSHPESQKQLQLSRKGEVALDRWPYHTYVSGAFPLLLALSSWALTPAFRSWLLPSLGWTLPRPSLLKSDLLLSDSTLVHGPPETPSPVGIFV